MSKADFVAKYQDRLVGLLMASFHDAHEGVASQRMDHKAVGRAMIEQMKKSRQMLDEMWESMQPPLPVKDQEPPKLNGDGKHDDIRPQKPAEVRPVEQVRRA